MLESDPEQEKSIRKDNNKVTDNKMFRWIENRMGTSFKQLGLKKKSMKQPPTANR